MTKKNFLLLLITTAIFTSCESDLQRIASLPAKGKFPTEKGTNVEIIYTDSARLKAKIFAPLMERYTPEEKPYMEMKQGITAYFYDRHGKVESMLKARYAIRYENEKTVELKNDVVVVNVNGDTLNTEFLIWEEINERIHSPGFVKITTKDQVTYGNEFESNQTFTKYRIKKFRGSFNIKGNAKTNTN